MLLDENTLVESNGRNGEDQGSRFKLNVCAVFVLHAQEVSGWAATQEQHFQGTHNPSGSHLELSGLSEGRGSGLGIRGG